MPQRKEKLEENQIYHIISRSIPEIKTFNDTFDYKRFILGAYFYAIDNPLSPFSYCRARSINIPKMFHSSDKLVSIYAYCLMPNHMHMLLSSPKADGISVFIHKLLTSYSHYFNKKYSRTGHLWQNRFKHVLIKTEEQLLHTTRYIHLNPVTAYLIDKPEQWEYSSYNEYLQKPKQGLCSIPKTSYDPINIKEFTYEAIENQRERAKHKKF